MNPYVGTSIIMLACVLSGCAGKPLDLAYASEGSDLRPVTINGPVFDIQALLPPRSNLNTMRIYIEGDGRAWRSSRTISNDPTPTMSLMVRYATEDTGPAAYLSRPCQFVMSEKCTKATWTAQRFGPEVVSALNSAVEKIKTEYGVSEFELVGHSGGGAIALLVAAARNDVSMVQTIAGNVDPEAWTKVLGLSPLNGSMNPTDFAAELAMIPQRHFIGTNDETVPGEVIYSYTLKVQPNCYEVIEVDADHWNGFDSSWSQHGDEALTCP